MAANGLSSLIMTTNHRVQGKLRQKKLAGRPGVWKDVLHGGGECEAGGEGRAVGGRGGNRDRGGVGGRRLAAVGAAGAAAGKRPDPGAGSARQGRGAARPLGRPAHRGLGSLGHALRAGLRPRAGPPLADALLPPRRLRSALRVRRRRHGAGRPADADAGDPARRRARGGGARPRAAGAPPALLRGHQRGRRGRQGAAARDAAARPRVGAVDPGRHPQPRQAARLRPLDQLGARAAARRHGAGARPRADRAARPRLPARQPDRRPDPVGRRGPAAGRADRLGAARPRLRHRGERLQQLGRLRRPLGDRDAADRGRPPPAAEPAGDLAPDRAALRRALHPRRLAAGDAGRLHGPGQRRLLDDHQRDG